MANSDSLSFTFVFSTSHIFFKYNWKKRRRCAWDSNMWQQDGRDPFSAKLYTFLRAICIRKLKFGTSPVDGGLKDPIELHLQQHLHHEAWAPADLKQKTIMKRWCDQMATLFSQYLAIGPIAYFFAEIGWNFLYVFTCVKQIKLLLVSWNILHHSVFWYPIQIVSQQQHISWTIYVGNFS